MICRKPDLNAPRFRPLAMHLLNRDLFKKFCEKYPEEKMQFEDFEKAIETFNENLWKTVVSTRDGAELPEGMGYLFVGSAPRAVKRKNIDYKKSVELGVIVTHKNWDTDGHVGKIVYVNYGSRYNFKGRELWQFKGTRDFTRCVASEYPKKWQMYARLANYKKHSKLFRMTKAREAARRHAGHFDFGNYNEFETT